MKFDTKCLSCEKTTELNTRMTVTIDDISYEIVFCDEHGDDITPKKAKDKVIKKLKHYNELVEQMKEFGVDVNSTKTSSGGIVLPTIQEPQPEPVAGPQHISKAVKSIILPKQQQAQPVRTMKVVMSPNGVGQRSPTNKSELLTVQPISGVASGGGTQVTIEGRSSVNIGETVQRAIEAGKKKGSVDRDAKTLMPSSKVVESQTVRGRGGQPMTIARAIKHSSGGGTIINVVDTGGDHVIQQRFRALASEGMRDNKRIYNYGEKGYDVANCTLCAGTGITASNGDSCPKCQGAGILNKGWT